MSAAQFHAEVMAELEQRRTTWVCTYCGRDCSGHQPETFICCGEVGHVEEVDEDTGEPV